jgi:alkylhydroperoxidase family enzyme
VQDTPTAKPAVPPEIAAREAEILGKPPRIAPLKREELDAEGFATLEALLKTLPLPADSPMPEFNATMLKHPKLYHTHSAFGIFMFEGVLSARDRELAILRTGWLSKAPFQWSTHSKLAKRLAGLTREDVERITVGSTAPEWNEHERAILRAVEELHEDAMISDATWEVLAHGLTEPQLMELPILVGHYKGVAYLQNSLRIRLMPGLRGLTSR